MTFFNFSILACSHLNHFGNIVSNTSLTQEDFFSPQEDFPVVEGDREEPVEITAKTRAQPEDKERTELGGKRVSYLEKELSDLEFDQNSQRGEFYQRYRDKLSTTSEKIFFLKLSTRDQVSYLYSRGLIKESSPKKSTSKDRDLASEQEELSLGMKKNDVISALGEPKKVEIAGHPKYENERWLYDVEGAKRYIYFESGQVHGWE